MTTTASCPCGCAGPVVLWSGSPATYRIACPACARTTARQPTEAEAVALWNEYASGQRSMA